MVEKQYEEVLAGIDVRQNLSEIRKEIKAEEEREHLITLMGKDYQPLIAALKNDDAKARRNAALLIGDLGENSCLDAIYEAYTGESQRFVKSAYLSAMKELQFEKYLPQLKERMELLLQEEVTVENKKHINEEIRLLSDMILEVEPAQGHEFRGNHTPSEVLLLTNRECVHTITESIMSELELDEDQIKEMRAGVRIQTDQIGELGSIRTYQEMLFLVPGMLSLEFDAKDAGAQIAASELLSFLEKRHKGKAPFYFRVELRSRMALSMKSHFLKKISQEIEHGSGRNLVNSTTNYEIEIRLIENKAGKLNGMVKLLTIPDDRFSYRKEHMPTSIKPVDAALIVALSRDFMKEDAQVLDPFCGVGTMLIERQKQVKANTSYGIDMMGEAIEKARVNTELAGQIIHFVNRDFFDFQHEYRFDEIITNLPFAQGHVSQGEIEEIYLKFFEKAADHLKEDGRMILYSHDVDLVRQEAGKNHYEIVKELVMNRKKGMGLFLLSRL